MADSSWLHAPALAGAASGAAQVLAEHPLDSVKVRPRSNTRTTTDTHTTVTHASIEGRPVAAVAVLPTQVRLQTRLAAFTAVGGGPLAMLRHTLRAEGAGALYQGLSPRLLTNGLVKLSLFSLYERWLPLCGGSPMLAGGLAGACNSLLSCPQDVLKSKLQARSSSSSSSSSSSRSTSSAQETAAGAQSR